MTVDQHHPLPAPEETGLSWLFLDLNSYFASVEQQDNPRLRGRPVAVVPMMTDGTCAIAASAEAKKYGIKTGTKIYEAKRMCPDLVCVLARHDAYVAYHEKVLSEVIKHTPIDKVWSIDELSSRLPPNKRNRDAAVAVAQRIKQGLRDNVGEYIKASIGIAPNGFLAKVATDMQKPDGLVVLEPAALEEKICALALRDFPGINVRMEERLRKAGITSTRQFWNLSPKHARRAWGSVEGEKFWYNMHGFHVPVQETNRSMVGHSRILDLDLRSPDRARLIARRLTVKAATRLRRMELYATQFDLSARTEDHEGWSAGVQLSPCQDNFAFLQTLDTLWDAMMKQLRPHRLKKVSVTMHGLCARQDITPDLFDFSSPERQKVAQKNDALSALMDSINRKYGSDSIRIGPVPKTQAGHVGTKIAFNRIPDMAEFHE